MSDGRRCAEPVRVEPRMRVQLTAELRTESSRSRCRIVDLSRGGACLELDSPVALGRKVSLHSGALSCSGTVLWVDGQLCGVRFLEPLRATELLVQMSQSRKSNVAPTPIPFSGGANFQSRSS